MCLLNRVLAVTGQLSVSYVKAGADRAPAARAGLILVSTGAVLGRGEAVMVLRDLADQRSRRGRLIGTIRY